MVLAEDPAAAGEGVLVEVAGLLVLAQRAQVVGEVAGRGEGVGVVVAEDAAAAGEGVLVEGAGLLVLAQLAAGRGRGCWPRRGCRGGRRPAASRSAAVGALEQRQRRARFAAGLPVGRGPVEQPGHLVGDVVERPVGVDGGQHVRQQLLPARPHRRVVPHLARAAPRAAAGPPPPAQPPAGRRVGCGRAAGRRGPGAAATLCGATVAIAAPVQEPGAPGQRERVGDDRGEPVGQRVGVVGEQVQRHRLRPAPRDQRSAGPARPGRRRRAGRTPPPTTRPPTPDTRRRASWASSSSARSSQQPQVGVDVEAGVGQQRRRPGRPPAAGPRPRPRPDRRPRSLSSGASVRSSATDSARRELRAPRPGRRPRARPGCAR